MSQPTRVATYIDRRRFLLGSAGVAASAGVASVAGAGISWANGDDGPLPAPKPIPGGLPVGLPPPFDLIHIFVPGPSSVTLPFSGTGLMGLDVEPSTITDFTGKTALAYLAGRARDEDGTSYNLEVDIRAFEGRYRSHGATHSGTFALI